jgi:hypothetical protein
MANVINITDRKSKLRPELIKQLNDIEGALALLDSHFTSDSDIAQKKNIFIKTVKGILKSRSVKFRVHLNGLSDVLGKKATLLFASEKIGFSLDVQSKVSLDGGWVIYPFDLILNPAENVGLIVAKLDEVKV